MSDRLKALADAGVSIWLDDLSRERIETGNLADLVKDKNVVGVTTNPTIFAAAIADGERYDAQVRKLVADGADVDQGDLRADHRGRPRRLRRARAGRRRSPRPTAGSRSRSSPTSPTTPTRTIASARALWSAVDRPNVLIKIPATREGLPAITAAIAEGISVNVTLIFSDAALPRGHGRLPGRAGAGPRRRARPRRGSSRWRRSSSPASTPRSTSGSRRSAPTRRWRCAARRPWPTRWWPTARSRRSSARTAGGTSRRRAPTGSARSGRRPASRTRTTTTRCTSRDLVVAGDRQHDAREDAGGVRRPRRGPAATWSPARRRGQRAPRAARARSASTSTT